MNGGFTPFTADGGVAAVAAEEVAGRLAR
jgi:hypothetical protein